MENKNSILITRSLQPNSLIRQWASAKNIVLIEKSFIQTTPVKGLVIPETDWIFFSSPQGVKLYTENYSIRAKKVAALSEGTAATCLDKGLTVLFTGAALKSTKEIGQDFFNNITSTETVLFPLSDISKKNISTQNGNHHVIELITYQTTLVKDKIENAPSLILFTSPSNVDGFLLNNTIPENTRIVAIGETTANRLKELKFYNTLISPSTAEKELIKLLDATRL